MCWGRDLGSSANKCGGMSYWEDREVDGRNSHGPALRRFSGRRIAKM
jgi:hypothetical protein